MYDLGHVGDKMPYGMHQWRQCDAYSMALNYAMEPRGLFEPAIHFQHGAGGGEAVGEFPLTYFLNGKLWKAIGLQPWTLRWTHLALLLLGCWCLFRTLSQLASPSSSLALTWLTMGSGLMAFYGPNYLVNAAGLGLVYVGWWEAYKWWQTGCTARKPQALMVLAFTLALLFRPTMALGLIPPALAVFGTQTVVAMDGLAWDSGGHWSGMGGLGQMAQQPKRERVLLDDHSVRSGKRNPSRPPGALFGRMSCRTGTTRMS